MNIPCFIQFHTMCAQISVSFHVLCYAVVILPFLPNVPSSFLTCSTRIPSRASSHIRFLTCLFIFFVPKVRTSPTSFTAGSSFCTCYVLHKIAALCYFFLSPSSNLSTTRHLLTSDITSSYFPLYFNLTVVVVFLFSIVTYLCCAISLVH